MMLLRELVLFGEMRRKDVDSCGISRVDVESCSSLIGVGRVLPEGDLIV